jgi:hypothetical protein
VLLLLLLLFLLPQGRAQLGMALLKHCFQRSRRLRVVRSWAAVVETRVGTAACV